MGIQSPQTRNEQNKRRKEIADLVDISPATLKSYYLYGQGPVDKWDAITSHITKVDQDTVVLLYQSHPYLSDQLEKLPDELATLLALVGKLSPSEIKLINGIINMCIEANKIGQPEK